MNTNTIKERKSVRTYNKKNIEQDVMNKIENFVSKIENPFNVPIEFKILDAKKDKLSSPVIIGADTYIAAKYEKSENGEAAFGYAFEKAVLYATSLGLGTVWLAATIDRKAFEKAIELKKDEVMPSVTPIGYEADKPSIRENLMRTGMKSDTRLPFEKIFYKGDFSQPLHEKEADIWLVPLEMIRLSPSATNKQPWRVVIDGNKLHFYEKKTRGYANENTGDIQKVDLGIAICHFEIAVQELGLKGKFVQHNPEISLPENTEYIVTYEMEV